MVLCEKTGKKIVEVCGRMFLSALKEFARRQNRMLPGVPETAKNQLFPEKNIGNFRKIRGGIDMICPVFSKK